jgi:hypothetical protein
MDIALYSGGRDVPGRSGARLDPVPIGTRRPSPSEQAAMNRLLQFLAHAVLMAVAGAAFAAPGDLLVSGPGHVPVRLSIGDLRALPAKSIAVTDEGGKPANYKGVRVADILARADLALPVLKGPLLTQTLLVTAADGYGVVFALAEIDPNFSDRDVLICYERDGAAMEEKQGPLRMVVPDDKRHARWVRRVFAIAIEPPIETKGETGK